MKINYWNCEFCDYDEIYEDDDEIRIYGCSHPNGTRTCPLQNKGCCDEDDCKLLDHNEQDRTI